MSAVKLHHFYLGPSLWRPWLSVSLQCGIVPVRLVMKDVCATTAVQWKFCLHMTCLFLMIAPTCRQSWHWRTALSCSNWGDQDFWIGDLSATTSASWCCSRCFFIFLVCNHAFLIFTTGMEDSGGTGSVPRCGPSNRSRQSWRCDWRTPRDQSPGSVEAFEGTASSPFERVLEKFVLL